MANQMVIKINGVPINQNINQESTDEILIAKWDLNKSNLKKMTINLWVLSGIIMTKQYTNASSLWGEMQPVFGIFKEIAMVIGAIALLTGLIIMVFKKTLGKTIINTAIVVILGCFLVPAIVMLIAIVGEAINGALTKAFQNLDIGNSVKVSGS